MGIPAARNLNLGNDAQQKKAKTRARDVKTLSQILKPILGDQAKFEAQNLVSEFGSLHELFHHFAKHDLRSVNMDQTAAGYLKTIALSLSYVLERDVLSGPVLPNSRTLQDYLFNSFYSMQNEAFRILFLDAANHLIEDRLMGVGTVDRVSIYPRQVIKSALDLNATAIVLAHNHPSGDPRPSQADISLTGQVQAACETFELNLIDHLVVARSGVVSMRELGLFKTNGAIRKIRPHNKQKTIGPFLGLRQIMTKLVGKI